MTPLTLEDATEYIGKWAYLKYGPANKEGILVMAECLIAIAGTVENAEWLSHEIIMGCAHFPAPIEMRRILAQHCAPADGIEPEKIDKHDYLDWGGKE